MEIQYRNPSDMDNISSSGDVLVLTGDCKKYGKDFFQKCSEMYKQTYIVMGNEDYYDGVDVNETLDAYRHQVYDNVTFLNNASIVIDEDELFFSTLWKCKDDRNDLYDEEWVDDYYNICCNGGNLSIDKEDQVHSVCVEWMYSALFESTAKRKIVVTHYDASRDKVLMHFAKLLGAETFYFHAA